MLAAATVGAGGEEACEAVDEARLLAWLRPLRLPSLSEPTA